MLRASISNAVVQTSGWLLLGGNTFFVGSWGVGGRKGIQGIFCQVFSDICVVPTCVAKHFLALRLAAMVVNWL